MSGVDCGMNLWRAYLLVGLAGCLWEAHAAPPEPSAGQVALALEESANAASWEVKPGGVRALLERYPDGLGLADVLETLGGGSSSGRLGRDRGWTPDDLSAVAEAAARARRSPSERLQSAGARAEAAAAFLQTQNGGLIGFMQDTRLDRGSAALAFYWAGGHRGKVVKGNLTAAEIDALYEWLMPLALDEDVDRQHLAYLVCKALGWSVNSSKLASHLWREGLPDPMAAIMLAAIADPVIGSRSGTEEPSGRIRPQVDLPGIDLWVAHALKAPVRSELLNQGRLVRARRCAQLPAPTAYSCGAREHARALAVAEQAAHLARPAPACSTEDAVLIEDDARNDAAQVRPGGVADLLGAFPDGVGRLALLEALAGEANNGGGMLADSGSWTAEDLIAADLAALSAAEPGQKSNRVTRAGQSLHAVVRLLQVEPGGLAAFIDDETLPLDAAAAAFSRLPRMARIETGGRLSGPELDAFYRWVGRMTAANKWEAVGRVCAVPAGEAHDAATVADLWREDLPGKVAKAMLAALRQSAIDRWLSPGRRPPDFAGFDVWIGRGLASADPSLRQAAAESVSFRCATRPAPTAYPCPPP